MGIKEFLDSTRRILVISKKPEGAEYAQMAKVTGLGIIIIGLIGFVILLIFALLKIGI